MNEPEESIRCRIGRGDKSHRDRLSPRRGFFAGNVRLGQLKRSTHGLLCRLLVGELTCLSVKIGVPTDLMGVRIGTIFPSEGLLPSMYTDASHRLVRGSKMVRRCMCRNPPKTRRCWYLEEWRKGCRGA